MARATCPREATGVARWLLWLSGWWPAAAPVCSSDGRGLGPGKSRLGPGRRRHQASFLSRLLSSAHPPLLHILLILVALSFLALPPPLSLSLRSLRIPQLLLHLDRPPLAAFAFAPRHTQTQSLPPTAAGLPAISISPFRRLPCPSVRRRTTASLRGGLTLARGADAPGFCLGTVAIGRPFDSADCKIPRLPLPAPRAKAMADTASAPKPSSSVKLVLLGEAAVGKVDEPGPSSILYPPPQPVGHFS